MAAYLLRDFLHPRLQECLRFDLNLDTLLLAPCSAGWTLVLQPAVDVFSAKATELQFML
jgi:hypothetical protein